MEIVHSHTAPLYYCVPAHNWVRSDRQSGVTKCMTPTRLKTTSLATLPCFSLKIMISYTISSKLSFNEAAGIFVSVYITYCILLALYRVYFHPRSRYPGSKLAVATQWYECYFDVIKRGRFAWEIKSMHEVYGPVVRITPHELHVSEPAFYDELYAGTSKKRDKYAWAYNLSLLSGSSWTTIEGSLHRNR